MNLDTLIFAFLSLKLMVRFLILTYDLIIIFRILSFKIKLIIKFSFCLFN